MTLFAAIRDACAQVTARAEFVTLVPGALPAYARTLPLHPPAAAYDLTTHYLGEPDDTVAYILTLDAVNFGSGYFSHLQKRPGLSGYFTIASALKDHYEQHGPLTPAALSELDVQRCGGLFGQDLEDPVRVELMRLFTQALNELGSYLQERFGGRFTTLIERADGSAEQLATLLAKMPYFQDVADYYGLKVPLYKRAQITASDLSLAFGGEGYGHFTDLDELTIFADNLVPHVLRVDGVLGYAPSLAARIDAGEPIAAGSSEEVEIRAVALDAAEELVRVLRAEGRRVSAQQLDVLLWNKGQAPRYKKKARHRTRTVFY